MQPNPQWGDTAIPSEITVNNLKLSYFMQQIIGMRPKENYLFVFPSLQHKIFCLKTRISSKSILTQLKK